MLDIRVRSGMKSATVNPVITRSTQLLLLFALLLGLIHTLTVRPSTGAPLTQVAAVEVARPLEAVPVLIEPLPPLEAPAVLEAPVAVETKVPVQPIQPAEERGDSLVYESEALFGTPFDHAIVMPFD